MDTRAKTALLKSIDKWTNVVNVKEVHINGKGCPLCREYFKKQCCGCPVYEDTKIPWCKNTPYEKVKTSSVDQYQEHATIWLVYLISLVENDNHS